MDEQLDKRRWRVRAAAERAAIEVDAGSYRRQLSSFLEREVPAGRFVVTFDAMAGEVDLGPLIAQHPDPSHRFALTRTPTEGHRLSVHAHGCPTERHRYGYQQPTADAPILADDRIGAVLVPGLAFDRSGIRLGRGKGYYDRFLGRLGAEVLRIGITGDYIVDELPAERFDVPMSHLATATGIHPVPLAPGGCRPG